MEYLQVLETEGVSIALETFTIIISLIAIIFWTMLFRRMRLQDSQDEGWLWIFASILMVLLINLAALVLDLASGRLPVGEDQVFFVNVDMLGFLMTFSRLVMALSLSIGTFLLYRSMNLHAGTTFGFTQVKPTAEVHRKTKAKYKLDHGLSYLISENPETRGKLEASGLDVFADLVTHKEMGLAITRTFPKKVRRDFGLSKTPIIWLTKEKDIEDAIHPSDLTELSHLIKDFVTNGKQTVILLDGLEYLILHNSFEDIVRLIEGIKDVVAQNESIMLVTIDPSTIDEKQYHILLRELKNFSQGKQ